MVALIEQAPLLLAGAVQLGLAAALLALRFHGRANRAFALVLAVLGTQLLLYGFSVGDGLAPGSLAARLVPYMVLSMPAAVAYFLLVYPRPRGALGRSRWLLPGLMAATAPLLAAYALDHALFSAGPLGLFDEISEIVFVVAAVVFARDALRRPGPGAAGLLLATIGFFAPSSCMCVTWRVLERVLYAWTPGGAPTLAYDAFLGLHVVLVLVLVGYVAAHAARRPDPGVRRALMAVIGVLALSTGLAAAVILAIPDPNAAFPAILTMYGLFNLFGMLAVTYAILRFQLLDLDLKVRWTVKQSTVAAAFVGVFFVVSEGAQTLLAGSFGPLLGLVAAGLLVFAIAPLQRAAERLATAAVPEGRPLSELGERDRASIYREQLELAWSDGMLTAKERVRLDRLRGRLGLSLADAGQLELEVAQSRA